MGALRLLVVHERLSVERAIREALASVAEVAVARHWEDARRRVTEGPWTGVVLGDHVDGRSGLELLRLARSADPTVPALLVSSSANREVANAAFASDALYLVQPLHGADLVTFLARAARGRVASSEALIGLHVARWVAQYKLTPSEREVLELAARGRSTKEIAAVRGHAGATTRKHAENLVRKTRDASLSEAAFRLLREALEAPSPDRADLRVS